MKLINTKLLKINVWNDKYRTGIYIGIWEIKIKIEFTKPYPEK